MLLRSAFIAAVLLPLPSCALEIDGLADMAPSTVAAWIDCGGDVRRLRLGETVDGPRWTCTAVDDGLLCARNSETFSLSPECPGRTDEWLDHSCRAQVACEVIASPPRTKK